LRGGSGRTLSSLSEIRISGAAGLDELRIDLRRRLGGAAALHAARHDGPDAIDDDSGAVSAAAAFEAGVAAGGEDLLAGSRRAGLLGRGARSPSDCQET
jgi:hypothetical protein